jgi:OmpA family
MIHYKITASNACGGTADQTALLHVVGSVDPAPAVVLASVFYPTDFPRPAHPKIGLVASERQILSDAANRFESHEQYDDDHASLTIIGHADIRGAKSYNLKLSERRAEAVKNFLVSKGVPADKIQVRADGKEHELGREQVAGLQSKDPQKPDNWMTQHSDSTWLAYNRRVDIILEPTGQQSTEAYPNDVSDARVLWQRAEPSLKTVESAANQSSGGPGPLHAGLAPN